MPHKDAVLVYATVRCSSSRRAFGQTVYVACYCKKGCLADILVLGFSARRAAGYKVMSSKGPSAKMLMPKNMMAAFCGTEQIYEQHDAENERQYSGDEYRAVGAVHREGASTASGIFPMPSTNGMMPSAMGRKEGRRTGRKSRKYRTQRQRMPMTSVPPAVKPRFLAFYKIPEAICGVQNGVQQRCPEKDGADMPDKT